MPGDKSAFIHGCTNLKLETIKKHEGSNNHLLAANKDANEKEPTKAPAFMAKMSLNKAIYIQGRPAQDYIWMNELDTMKGLLPPEQDIVQMQITVWNLQQLLQMFSINISRSI